MKNTNLKTYTATQANLLSTQKVFQAPNTFASIAKVLGFYKLPG